MRRITLISPFLAFAVSLAGQTGGEYSVDPRFQGDRTIDRILSRVDARQDQWIGERDFESINARLKAVAGAIKKGERDFSPLRAHLERFRKVSVAELKIVGSRRASASASDALIDVRVELGGEAPDGKLLSLLGPMSMRWTGSGDDWALAEAELGELREVSTDGFQFAEISDQVFGGIDSYRRQLGRDVDDWRGTLDAAVGVQVYGHHGLSAGDYDGDGLDDLYLSEPGGLPNRLYRNNGDGTFSDRSRAAGLDVLDDTSMSLFGDLDNDGDQDLILIGAEPLLFVNEGGRFVRRADAGLKPPPDKAAMLTGAALADYDSDGDLDLYVCAYDFWQAGSDYDAPTPYYDATNGPPNLLFRNNGDGTFEEATEAAGLGRNNDRFSFAASWSDYDGDGDPDLYVANDFGRNNLYRNNGDGTFSDVAREAGVEDLGAGMSVSWGDYDNDGDPDLYASNMWSSAGQRLTFNAQFAGVAASEELRAKFQRQARGNSLFRNNGDGTFTDVAEQAGVTMGRWAWGSELVDLDADGLLDIFVQNGYITGERLDDL